MNKLTSQKINHKMEIKIRQAVEEQQIKMR